MTWYLILIHVGLNNISAMDQNSLYPLLEKRLFNACEMNQLMWVFIQAIEFLSQVGYILVYSVVIV